MCACVCGGCCSICWRSVRTTDVGGGEGEELVGEAGGEVASVKSADGARRRLVQSVPAPISTNYHAATEGAPPKNRSGRLLYHDNAGKSHDMIATRTELLVTAK